MQTAFQYLFLMLFDYFLYALLRNLHLLENVTDWNSVQLVWQKQQAFLDQFLLNGFFLSKITFHASQILNIFKSNLKFDD